MTRRTRAWLGVIALIVVLGTVALASVRVGALTGSSSVLEPLRDQVRVQLPGRGGRLTLLVGTGSWVPLDCQRHIMVERTGQAVIDTPVFPGAAGWALRDRPLLDRRRRPRRPLSQAGRSGRRPASGPTPLSGLARHRARRRTLADHADRRDGDGLCGNRQRRPHHDRGPSARRRRGAPGSAAGAGAARTGRRPVASGPGGRRNPLLTGRTPQNNGI